MLLLWENDRFGDWWIVVVRRGVCCFIVEWRGEVNSLKRSGLRGTGGGGDARGGERVIRGRVSVYKGRWTGWDSSIY